MKVLVVLNENPPGSHPDVYEAFTGLIHDGLIESYDVYSHLLARANGLSDAQICRALLDLVGEYEYDLVVWMHTGRLSIDDATLRAMKALPQRPLMAYWEKDSYHPIFKPVPKEMLGVMRYCDRVFVPCGGPFLKSLAKADVGEARYAPSSASEKRFPLSWEPQGPFEQEVVLIGNRVTSKIPFKTMPGARERQRLVKAFENRFGSAFAVYGRGWAGPSARGPCGFDQQREVNASTRVAVGVNNSDYAFVFSNRLPIALACGVPLLYRRNPGFEQVFGDTLADRFFDTIPQAIALAERLLGCDDEVLRAESRANRLFFERNLTTKLVARYVVSETAGCRAGNSNSDRANGNSRGAETGAEPLWQKIPPLISGGRIHG